MSNIIKASVQVEATEGSLQASITKQEATLQPVKVAITSTGDITKTYKEIGTDFDTITKKVTNANDATKNFTNTVYNYESASKRTTQQIEQQARNLDIVSTKTENYSASLERLKISGSLTEKQFSDFSSQLTNLKTKFDNGEISLSEYNKGLNTLNNNVQEAVTKHNSLGQSLGNIVKKFATWYLIAGAVTSVINGLKSIISITMELDEAFTDIQMVTQSTDTELKNLKQSYIDLAQEMGVTVETITTGANEWLRSGLSIKETNEALRASIVLSTIANMDSADSTKYLIAVMNAYNLQATDLMSVVDKLSAVDIVAATSSEELAEALSVSAKSAQLAGIDLDKYLGMIAAVSETTRQSASTIGNSFKTIFARLQAVKIGSLYDEEGESISNVDTLLKNYGIDLMTVTDDLTDMGALLDYLGGQWDSYTSAQKSEIATTVAGKQALCPNI